MQRPVRAQASEGPADTLCPSIQLCQADRSSTQLEAVSVWRCNPWVAVGSEEVFVLLQGCWGPAPAGSWRGALKTKDEAGSHITFYASGSASDLQCVTNSSMWGCLGPRISPREREKLRCTQTILPCDFFVCLYLNCSCCFFPPRRKWEPHGASLPVCTARLQHMVSDAIPHSLQLVFPHPT